MNKKSEKRQIDDLYEGTNTYTHTQTHTHTHTHKHIHARTRAFDLSDAPMQWIIHLLLNLMQ